ncbi:uncharacterized protein SCHCODRAFT_02689502 [Schizophyllum commune H4-8]|uniref:Expressed protein n=1 Tax=Schizophyllum commune (strain H4-8 / FGSC 9210) TaxID=578458 RepID=D8Q7Z0_SCHCM|nr:uncharacterized protein SCHCODRAFT_02689502 [Schizophyllum commune H4-8]KAI5891284.1 hypothetical protein SCHCODRAFT_02689502 [Schizophyllum commune H4-8]
MGATAITAQVRMSSSVSAAAPYPPHKGTAIIMCSSTKGDSRLFGVFESDLVGSKLYQLIHEEKSAQPLRQDRDDITHPPVIHLPVDPSEMLVLLDALHGKSESSTVSGGSPIWCSLVLARLSSLYGTPALMAKAFHHLCDVFCCDLDSIYQLPFARDDFTIAVAAVETALACEGAQPWLLPLALAYCAQFSPVLMLHPTSFKTTKPLPTGRSYALSDEHRDICIQAHEAFLAARKYRLSQIYVAPAYECTTPSECRVIIERARKDAEADLSLIGATTKPSPKLAKRLRALCSECLELIDWQDDIALYVILKEAPQILGDSRSWEEIRECALEYLETLPPVEAESRSDDDSDSCSSEFEAESRGRASGSRKKAKVLTSDDERGFVDILAKALNWLE